MAFVQRSLQNLHGSGDAPKVWTYENTADTIATITAAGYFLAATNLLEVGDTIYCRGSDGTAWVTVLTSTATALTTGPGGALEGSTTWDPGSILDGDEVAQEITVTGAALGDFALASFSLDVTDLVINAAVTAADTVTVVLANSTGGTIDLASGTVRARVFKAAS
ncbi:hypothetical protein DVVG_00003 [Dunaliella viridis virus SI2]|uniref:hypothetical protein n=1 Tax=Dunaliella viridis virus SI2 TaxID=754069 RepID=UPI0002C09B69|nr:hypothetical protein DVVG_00003 [Dunaliella viridis virus SI2]AGH15989.1 hypothetical protein DVVG_00003 [Dunaliella viridis virus SI2]